MGSIPVILITHIFAFFFGLVISKSRKRPDQYVRPILGKLPAFSEWFSSENARAARAAKLLDQIKVELLDR